MLTNGVVRGFRSGVLATNHTSLVKMRISGNESGVSGFRVDFSPGGLLLQESAVSDNLDTGVTLAGINGSSLISNRILRNGGAGVSLGGHSDLTVMTGNEISRNTGPGVVDSQSFASFTNNKLAYNGGDGIVLSPTWAMDTPSLVTTQHTTMGLESEPCLASSTAAAIRHGPTLIRGSASTWSALCPSVEPLRRALAPRGRLRAKAGTFLIVGADPGAGEVGVAVQSKYFAVGAVVPWAGGAVATQAAGVAAFGPAVLAELEIGTPPDEATRRSSPL